MKNTEGKTPPTDDGTDINEQLKRAYQLGLDHGHIDGKLVGKMSQVNDDEKLSLIADATKFAFQIMYSFSENSEMYKSASAWIDSANAVLYDQNGA